MNDYWCIPPKESDEFVANMEDILDIYEMPYNPELPVVFSSLRNLCVAGATAVFVKHEQHLTGQKNKVSVDRVLARSCKDHFDYG